MQYGIHKKYIKNKKLTYNYSPNSHQIINGDHIYPVTTFILKSQLFKKMLDNLKKI